MIIELKQNTQNKQSDAIKEIFDEIKAYRTPVDNRLLSETFTRLPTKRGNADYYELVKEPIDLLKISQKIKFDQYKSYAEFDADMVLLVSNAKLFHKKPAQEHKDACALMDLYVRLKKERHIRVIKQEVKHEPTDAAETATEQSTKRKSRGTSTSASTTATVTTVSSTKSPSAKSDTSDASTAKQLNRSASLSPGMGNPINPRLFFSNSLKKNIALN